jgi:2'-5' RNA ligase
LTQSRRLFLALWPDDAVRHALLHWQTRHLPAAVRWQHWDDLHMTLHFLGAVDADRLDGLHRFADGVEADGFVLRLSEIGWWPGPRGLWCAPGEVPDGLVRLHGRLAEGLAALGLPVESRAYRPHVTLARRVPEGGAGRLEPAVNWSVREWALCESRSGPPPVYRVLGRWRLPT